LAHTFDSPPCNARAHRPRSSLERHVACSKQKMVDAIGWLSSLILLATILAQVRKQWRDPAKAGVTKWLFIGQTAASLGFTVYSALLGNWVFTVTNALLLLAGVAGAWIALSHPHQPSNSRVPAGQS